MPQPAGPSSTAPPHQITCPHETESTIVTFRRARNEMMLLDTLFTLFLTHVGSLTNVENNQRRFAPTPAHIERNYLPTSPEYAPSCFFAITLEDHC
jgi:hypothetical protein